MQSWICMVFHCLVSNPTFIHKSTSSLWLSFFCSAAYSGFLCVYRTVVKCNIAKSQALYSAQRGLKTNNAAVFKVGAIMINIPQHPATLHSMMVRSSHQLSKQISDLIRQPSNAYVCFTYSAFLTAFFSPHFKVIHFKMCSTWNHKWIHHPTRAVSEV